LVRADGEAHKILPTPRVARPSAEISPAELPVYSYRLAVPRDTALNFHMASHDWKAALNRFSILWPERMPALERNA